MKLVFSGSWLGLEGLYEAGIKKIHMFSSLKDLYLPNFGFILLSYHESSETLGLSLKSQHYPNIVLLELEDVHPLAVSPSDSVHLEPISSSFGRDEFMGAVERVKGLIEEGVLYQLNLTCRFDFELCGAPFCLFMRYYQRQQVPYAFFLETEDFYLLSGSMELFLEKRGSLVRSKPIKGTSTSREELTKSSKDKAENLMITDMVRNDLSRVALPGSVMVEELFKVEEFSTLFQMHSSVIARTERDIKSILEAVFPPASVVGAPKRKAVEVIDLIEPHAREYYCGCAGFVKGEDFTLSVLIRTALGRGRLISYYAGAGIVWDSTPEREWQEVLLKTRAFYEGWLKIKL